VLLLALTFGCTGPKSDDGDTAGPDTAFHTAETAPDSGETGDSVDPCEAGPCFTACGLPVVVTAPIVATGFVPGRFDAWYPRDLLWKGGVAWQVDGRGLIRRDRDLLEIGRVPMLPTALRVELAGTAVFLGNGNAGVSVVSEADGEPLAWWSPSLGESGYEYLRLAGVSRERLVVDTSRGTSVLDVSDPLAPTEAGCLEADLPDSWGAAAEGDFAFRITEAGIDVMELSGDAPRHVDSITSITEAVPVLDGGRLLVWNEDRDLILYGLGTDAVTEVGRRDRQSESDPSSWDPAHPDGLVLSGGERNGGYWAVDMAEPELPLHHTTEPESGRWSCVARFDDEADEPSWDVSPMWFPDERFDPGELASLVCPDAAFNSYGVGVLHRSPAGDAVLYQEDSTWYVLPFDGAEPTAVAEGYGQWGFWLGESFAIAEMEGYDWGIPLISTIDLVDAGGTAWDTILSPGPFVALVGQDDAVWVLSEPRGRDYGEPAPPAEDNILWRVDPDGGTTEVPLPSGAAARDLVADGEGFWIVDEDGFRVDRLDGEGALLERCELPAGWGGGGRRVASTLGLFLHDDDGAVVRVEPGCTVSTWTEGADGGSLVEHSLAGADERWLYLSGPVGPAAGYTTWNGLRAVDPDTFEALAWIPTWGEAIVSAGDPVVVAELDLYLLDRP
jgi:hypothetical protein